MNAFHATDADLPEIFFRKIKPHSTPPTNADLQNIVKAAVHYPGFAKEQKDLEDRARKENERDRKEVQREGCRVYVRSGKVQQMLAWLRALYQQRTPEFTGLNEWERGFCKELVVKFTKYRGRIKYVTLKQYEKLQTIAGNYLEFPKETP